MRKVIVLLTVLATSWIAAPPAAHAAGEFCGLATTIFGTNGDDSPATGFDGTPDDDVMFAFRGDDLVFGRAGDDRLCGSKGNDEIDGSDGDDGLFGQDGNDTMRGGSGRDELYGLGGTDELDGEQGADYVDGGAGPDHLRGGSRPDDLYGGTGDDVLDAFNGGADHLFGEGGNDTCRVDPLDVYEGCETVEMIAI